MHIQHYKKVEGVAVTSPDAKGATMHVVAGPQQGAQNFTMRVFELEPGGYSFDHHHDFEHEIFFHQGKGEVDYNEKTIKVSPGDTAFIPPNVQHQIRNTGDETMVFVCVIPNRE